ncbi:MAG: Exodeoxyribonuclease [Actinomycetota bacterium]|nr:Exodeoxyribonuclease [Actinomycetota bacterium]
MCSANVNGIRAAQRRGGVEWLAERAHDVVLLQEVRASTAQLTEAVADLGPVHLAHAESAQAGRSGVAIVSRSPLSDVRIGVGDDEAITSGRWIEASVDSEIGPVRLISVYVHSGEAGTARQKEKYLFLDAATARMAALVAESVPTLLCGDINIAHTSRDIRNAKGNIGKAGYLPAEQEYLSRWLGIGWTDLGRRFAGDVDGPYTWWSWRGQAFDRDTGWRIDNAYATPGLAARVVDVRVGRAASYAERWSDHAPVTLRFRV